MLLFLLVFSGIGCCLFACNIFRPNDVVGEGVQSTWSRVVVHVYIFMHLTLRLMAKRPHGFSNVTPKSRNAI